MVIEGGRGGGGGACLGEGEGGGKDANLSPSIIEADIIPMRGFEDGEFCRFGRTRGRQVGAIIF